MKTPIPDLADRKNVVTVNLGASVGAAVRKVAKDNQLNLSIAVRMLLRKALSKPGSLAKFSGAE